MQEELAKQNPEIFRFYKAFQGELIENLTLDRFADIYAQTITYGLFSARMKVQTGFKRETVWQFIPESLPLLKEIFYSLTGPHFPESLIWIVDDIIQVLEKADISAILQEFKSTRWEDDPVIHFYETFLATYNPEERQRLGVYYTPLPVVSYIVRSIHKLLKDKFGKAEGLATNDVTLLDPAAGTLTFVVQAIKQVQTELAENNKTGLLKSYIAEHILPHFHAFEILVAPYTVGHFKVARLLEELGYQFKKDERFQFYLTNTLEMKEPKQLSFLIDLTKEGQEAKRIKEKVPILVVLGNPPYSVSSENKSEFIETLMDDYKEDVRDERNIQPLSDDYIKFIRFAHWKIEHAKKGILGFITNNSYLSGIIHRGMRKKLLETFDEIYVLNLHGSSRIGEQTPDGGPDENVFDIQQGVAIVLFVKLDKPLQKKKVYYSDLWGSRETKYTYLFANNIQTTEWQELTPTTPYFFLVPKDFRLQTEYDKFWKVTEIFKKWSSGVMTRRDNFMVALSREELVQRLRLFVGNLSDEMLWNALKIKDTKYWSIKKARDEVRNIDFESKIIPYAYRPFDIRFVFYFPKVIERGDSREPLMKHIVNKNNLVLVTVRLLSGNDFHHVQISHTIGDACYISSKTKEKNYYFPLFLYPEEHEEQLVKADRSSNFTEKFLQTFNASLGSEPTPGEIFYYIYAVLYSPTYRKRYQEFLKIEFPRIPLPANQESFTQLSQLGKELIELHLLNHPALNQPEIGFPQSGTQKVDKVSYDEQTNRVYINKTQYFEGVTPAVWEYHIGSYQVMEKYLKDRKTRTLTLDEINHYLKMAKSIRLTIELQTQIDTVFQPLLNIT